jgi:hypothetical protein
MSFKRAFQWYHSHADPIWPDGTSNGTNNHLGRTDQQWQTKYNLSILAAANSVRIVYCRCENVLGPENVFNSIVRSFITVLLSSFIYLRLPLSPTSSP